MQLESPRRGDGEHVREALEDGILMANLPTLLRSMLLRSRDLLVGRLVLKSHLVALVSCTHHEDLCAEDDITRM